MIALMIVIAIIGILAVVAFPVYDTYRNRTRFSEAVLAVGNYRTGIAAAAQSGRFATLNDIDAGTNGVPPAVVRTATLHGIDVVNGVVTVTWKNDGTSLAGVNFTITAQSPTPPVNWVPGGSCVALGYC